MSCQVHLTAHIQETDAIRRCLFPTEDQRGTDSWLQQCKVSPSPTGDLIVLANERKIVVLTSKWYSEPSLSYFHITYSGSIHEYDKVKALVCLPIVGVNGSTHIGPDWTCILVGFDSGHVRCYTENCELLFEEQFHAENITTIRCQSQHNPRPDISPDLHQEEIHVQYQSTLCVLSGPQLVSILRKCRSELENGSTLNHPQNNIIPKKWGFLDQSVIHDSAVVGLSLSSAFDHLATASTCGGFETKYRSMPPHNTLVLAAGSKPFLGYHYALEGGAQPVLSDVAKAVASKLKSALPSWLTGTKSQSEKQISLAMQPPEPMGCRFGLCDLQRTATDIVLSPDRKLAAVCDTIGRVLLVDSFQGIALKIFKGYRDAQCSFIQVPEERKTKNKSGNRVGLFLIIYSPKKGTLEIFSVQLGTRIATFTAAKHSRLIYITHGLMGFTTTSKSRYICQYTTIFIDNDGQVKEISIPFHFALAEKNNKRARDLHLYKKLRHLVKSGETEKLRNEAVNTCIELKTDEFKSQTVDILLGMKNIPATVSLQCVQYLASNLVGDGEALKVRCENATALLELYLFVTNLANQDRENGNSEQQEDTILNVDGKEMEHLQKLLDLNTLNNNRKLNEVHVSFSDNSSFSPSEFLSIFDMSKPERNCLKENVDESILFKSAEVLFKPYIMENHNFAELENEITKARLPTKNLFNMLVNYWVNRSLHINLSLEKEMCNLSKLIYTIAKTAGKDVLSTEYSKISSFWNEIRDLLADSARPFPALIAAILCKRVAQTIETELQLAESSTSLDDDSMEVLTREVVQWSMLIGKLEDISLLNIILSTKPAVQDSPLPKLQYENVDISLKYILNKGRGSVTELAAKWLTSTGVNPQNIILNDSQYKSEQSENAESDDAFSNNLSKENLFEQLNLLKTKFPYSVEASSLLANMAWEYALAWQRNIQNLENLEAAIKCLSFIQDMQIKQGLYQLVWNTHLKIVNENACKLINKVGKLPKERLCKQDTGLSDYQISLFVGISTEFLDSFLEITQESYKIPKSLLKFENIWENGGQPLVELAVLQREVNYDLLHSHYQLSLVLQMITTFSIKYTKPIHNLFDATIANLFFTDLQRKCQVTCNRSDIKLNNSRQQFLSKIVSASLESVTVNDSGNIYFTEHVRWMSKCVTLARFWNLDVDSLKCYQVVQLFSNGYDNLGEELIPAINNRVELGKLLLTIAVKRLKHFLSSSPDLSENISALSTPLTKYMESLDEEWCAPSSLRNLTYLATYILQCLNEDQSEHRLAMLLLEACNTLEDIQS
ncbi:hypothetical protein JTB14_033440 [Gonioctena quinquepunctata]|nr:hypothetical protein JTB14_033440 [Gonioctena quinquepunctata]